MRCSICNKFYATLMGCKRHMVAKHGYEWNTDKTISKPQTTTETKEEDGLL